MLDQVAIIIEHPVFVHPSIEIEISFVLISFRIGHTIGHVEEKARRNVSKERESYQELQGSGEIDAVWKFCLEGDDQLFQAVQANQFDQSQQTHQLDITDRKPLGRRNMTIDQQSKVKGGSNHNKNMLLNIKGFAASIIHLPERNRCIALEASPRHRWQNGP